MEKRKNSAKKKKKGKKRKPTDPDPIPAQISKKPRAPRKQRITGNPMGRPTKYDSSHCQALIDHMAGGFSFESFGGVIGVCSDTLYRWAKNHADFSEAIKRARMINLYWWESQAVRMIKERAQEGCSPAIFIHQINNRFRSLGWGNSDVGQPNEAEDVEFTTTFGGKKEEDL